MYINTYIWNLERWYWWTYLQGSNGEQTYGQGGGEEGEGEMSGESSMEAYTLPYVKQIAKGSFLYDSENSNCDSVTT